jgi:DNA invertase Pin-like site-specific DNA recombinase
LSPDLQEAAIEQECRRSGLTIIETYHELDASGGDASRKLWNLAIERIERGDAKGLVVWNLTRFSRSLSDALKAIERIEAAGGRLYSASGEGGDDSPTGRMTRNLFLSIAEMERERLADGFSAAQERAIARGQHFASRTPVGYLRGEDRILVPDPVMAPVVVTLFERRARGESWAKLARWFIGAGGSPKTNASAVRNITRNRAYLGEARHGPKVNRKAHEPIVSRKLFDDANAVVGKKNRGDGSLTSAEERLSTHDIQVTTFLDGSHSAREPESRAVPHSTQVSGRRSDITFGSGIALRIGLSAMVD